jgi:hypothetical protein
MFGESRSPLTNVSESSRPGIPAERDRQTIQDLHVAIDRGTLLRVGGCRGSVTAGFT